MDAGYPDLDLTGSRLGQQQVNTATTEAASHTHPNQQTSGGAGRRPLHGKEWVDGSSPSEDSASAAQVAAARLRSPSWRQARVRSGRFPSIARHLDRCRLPPVRQFVVWFVTRPETEAPMPHDRLANPSSEE
jgi:hypothetical protein